MSERKLENWVDSWLDYTDITEAPSIYRKWTAISLIASAMQRRCKLELGLVTFYPNLYIVLIGPSGVRKGTALGPAKQLLSKVGIKLSADANTKEALIKRLCESGGATEYFGGKIHMDSCLTIFSSEFTVFLVRNDTQFIDDLCDWYDCAQHWEYDTKNSGTDSITNLWVNLLAATTPTALQLTLPTQAIGGGLTSRIIFVYAGQKGKIISYYDLTDDDRRRLQVLEEDYHQIKQITGIYKPTMKFKQVYDEFVHVTEASPPFTDPRFAGYNERRRGHVLKLAMICRASYTNDLNLDEVDLITAISTLEEVEKSMPMAFAGIGKSDISSVVNDVMVFLARYKKVSQKSLLRHFVNDVDGFTLDRVMDVLKKSGYVQEVIDGNQIKYEFIEQAESRPPSSLTGGGRLVL